MALGAGGIGRLGLWWQIRHTSLAGDAAAPEIPSGSGPLLLVQVAPEARAAYAQVQRRLMRGRPDLRIVAMSATLDGARVGKLLGDAPVVASEGRAFPVETRYLGRKADAPIERQMADAIATALRADPGSVLAFLPGAAEIRRTQNFLGERVHDASIEIVPLYFSEPRPVVERDGLLIMVDDDRFPLRDGERPQMRSIRFRTLGCYPLTGAIDSDADTLDKIIAEMEAATTSERQGRVIDHDPGASMEQKKQAGYF